jgi:hypothetical protein
MIRKIKEQFRDRDRERERDNEWLTSTLTPTKIIIKDEYVEQ